MRCASAGDLEVALAIRPIFEQNMGVTFIERRWFVEAAPGDGTASTLNHIAVGIVLIAGVVNSGTYQCMRSGIACGTVLITIEVVADIRFVEDVALGVVAVVNRAVVGDLADLSADVALGQSVQSVILKIFA